MNLSHRLLSSALLAGAVFSVTTLPLTTLGTKPVTIQIEERPVFVGQLRELAGPYLALATGVSLGVGAVCLAVSSWRSTAHKLERNEAEIAALKQQLHEKTMLVEQLKFSGTRLQSSGLEHFLQAEETVALRAVSTAPTATAPQLSRPAIPQTVPHFDRPRPAAAQFSTAGLEFFLNDDATLPGSSDRTLPLPEPAAVKAIPASTYADFTITPITESPKIQAVSSLPAAQPFKGFVRPDAAQAAESSRRSQPNYPSEPSPQLNELLGHLKQVMTQIERLNSSQSSRRNGV